MSLGKSFKHFDRLIENCRVWRTRDVELENRLRKTYQNVSESEKRRQDVLASIHCQIGHPFRLTLRTSNGAEVHVQSDILVSDAKSRPVSEAAIRTAVGDLGGTPFRITEFEFSGIRPESSSFFPLSAVKELRRRAVDMLTAKVNDIAFADVPGSHVKSKRKKDENITKDIRPRITVLCRKPSQVDVVIQHCPWIDEIYVDFLEVHGLGDAIKKIQNAGRHAVAVFPRVTKPDEMRLVDFYLVRYIVGRHV